MTKSPNRTTPPPRPSRGRPQAKTNQTRLLMVAVAVVVVAALVVAIVANSGSSNSASSATTVAPEAAAAVVASVLAVPVATQLAVGAGTATALPVRVSATPIAIDGKPEVLYVGAEYCPFCAAQRWPLMIALSRFGTFDGVGITRSSSTDVHPDTPTLAFHGSTYTSDLLAFTPIEVATNIPNGSGGYTALDSLSSAQQKIVAELSPDGSIPFVDLGGRYLLSGASLDASVFSGQTAAEVAAALTTNGSAISDAVLGAANGMTAALCQLTNGQPGGVCSAPAIVSITSKLGT